MLELESKREPRVAFTALVDQRDLDRIDEYTRVYGLSRTAVVRSFLKFALAKLADDQKETTDE
jgi:hypothetical protein